MLVGGRAPIGGGGLIRLLTLIPDAESPRFLLSTTPDGAIATHVRGCRVAVGLAVASAEIEIDEDSTMVGVMDNEGVAYDVSDGVSVIEGVTEDVSDGVSVIEGVREDVSDGVSVIEGVTEDVSDGDIDGVTEDV